MIRIVWHVCDELDLAVLDAQHTEEVQKHGKAGASPKSAAWKQVAQKYNLKQAQLLIFYPSPFAHSLFDKYTSWPQRLAYEGENNAYNQYPWLMFH